MSEDRCATIAGVAVSFGEWLGIAIPGAGISATFGLATSD